MSILSALKQQTSSMDDLAKLPQSMIMQMAQRKEIAPEMVAPILSRKAELMDAVARTQAMQQAGQAPSVMEQIMQKNAVAEHPMQQPMPQMAEAGVAQIPVREPKYAGGGIVAFAGGGMYDTEANEGEESEAEEMARLYPKSKLAELIDSGVSGIRGLMAKLPRSYETEKGLASMKEASGKGSHPYEADAIKAAKQVGLDPNVMLHALYKETGGHKDPATAKSKAGAYGPMQLMPATAKELGVDYKDPYQNLLGGATYLKKQMDTFNDPQLALAAYNAGPGAVRKALAHKLGVASLPKETQGYMKYSGGGDVKGYAAGDQVFADTQDREDWESNPENLTENPYLNRSIALNEQLKKLGKAFTTPRNYDPVTKLMLDPLQAIQKWGQTSPEKQAAEFNAASNLRKASAAPEAVSAPVSKTIDKDVEKAKENVAASPNFGIKSNLPTRQAPSAGILSDRMSQPQPSSDDDYFTQLKNSILTSREEAKAAREENRNMALLQAGLGILGGTSPYAMANIGAGALHGAQAYGQGQRDIRAQERDLMNLELGIGKYASAARNAALDREALAKYREQSLAQGAEKAEETSSDRAFLRLQQMEKDLVAQASAPYKNNPMFQSNPEKFAAQIQNNLEALKKKHKVYNQLYERAMGVAPEYGSVATTGDRKPLSSFQR